MPTAGDLGPGLARMRPDDHFMAITDTPATPMHIGALQFLAAPPGDRAELAQKLRAHLLARLPNTPLMVQLREAPDGYDSDVWVDVAEIDVDYHLQIVPDRLDEAGVRRFIAQQCMQRIDLARPPFRIFILPNLEGDRVALHYKVHHCFSDGIGFQTILGRLSDDGAPNQPPHPAAHLPSPEAWRAAADARFEAEAELRERKKAEMAAALAKLKSGELPPRSPTPTLKLSGPTSMEREYATQTIALERVKAVGKALGGTVNDIFLSLASSAIRRRLIEIDDLPDEPLTINAARSYRRPEHGEFGNRIVALHPHIATNLADPIARLRAIQESMKGEWARTPYDEAMLGAPEKPYGARDRRARFAARTSTGAAVIPGNVTLSNVPGPEGDRYVAGLKQLANFPTPILGSGRFLNITSRRNGPNLDMGIMVDPTKLPEAARIGAYLVAALEEYEALVD